MIGLVRCINRKPRSHLEVDQPFLPSGSRRLQDRRTLRIALRVLLLWWSGQWPIRGWAERRNGFHRVIVRLDPIQKDLEHHLHLRPHHDLAVFARPIGAPAGTA